MMAQPTTPGKARHANPLHRRQIVNQPLLVATLSVALLSSCNVQGDPAAPGSARETRAPAASAPTFAVAEVATFNEPWAMSFLPDGRLLVTEKRGALKLLKPGGKIATVTGTPAVDYGGQGGFGDVVPHPQFASNGWIYLSYAEKGERDTRGAAVARARLTFDAEGGGALSELRVIWRQVPKVDGRGHYGHRIAFGPDGKLWISSGERQHFDPAQDMRSNLGKVLRLNDDGSTPADNPFVGQGPVSAQIWTLGHRNLLGMAFDAQARLWVAEMGPKGGDELNLIERGRNYGWPKVSNGNHYDGSDIPDHDTAPEFEAPKISWTPVIAPASMIFYSGAVFPDWRGDALLAGLASKALVRVEFDGDRAREAARYDMGQRIREVEQGPAGEIWLLEDGPGGRLLKLSNPAPTP